MIRLNRAHEPAARGDERRVLAERLYHPSTHSTPASDEARKIAILAAA